MENEHGLYMAFTSEGYYFLIPLSWVKIVKNGEEMSNLPVLDFSELLEYESDLKEKRHLIVMENGEDEFGILAECALGVYEIEEGVVMKLREPVINESNRYLSGVTLMLEPDKGQRLTYILDPEILYTMCMDRIQEGL